MIKTLANGLVISGFLILIATLLPTRKLVEHLPKGPMRQKWLFQSGLILVFIAGYLADAIVFWNKAEQWADLIVPGVFFFGAAFVWMTINLALQTAMDIRRVTLLEQENITDSLIGVYNRRYLDRRLEEEFERAKRHQLDLALLLIDIDHFKLVNDTYGHPAGDMVLRQWGGLIMEAVRAADVVARYGGEEILVIAPGTKAEAAFALAERIRRNIEAHEFIVCDDPCEKSASVRITASVGVGGLTARTGQLDDLLKETDRALYDAKREGRNCVKMDALLAQG